jgi:signal transduction histidine kinase/CheY-like chemotaxis protein
LLAVSGAGIFYLEDGAVIISQTGINEEITTISSVSRLDPNTLVIGTLDNGAFFIQDSDDGFQLVFSSIQRANALVLKTKIGPNGNLWISENNRIRIFNSSFPVRLLSKQSNYPECYLQSLEIFGGSIYLGSSIGVSKSEPKSDRVSWSKLTVNESGKSTILNGSYYFDDYDCLRREKDGEVELFHRFDREIRSFEFASDRLLHVAFNDRLGSYHVDGSGQLELLNEYATLNSLIMLEGDGEGRTWGWSPLTPLLEIFDDAAGELQIRRHDTIGGKDMYSVDHEMAVTEDGPVLVFEDLLARYNAAGNVWEATGFDPGIGRPQALVFSSGEDGLTGWITYWDTELSMNLLVEVNWPKEGSANWSVLPWIDMGQIGKVSQMSYVEGDDPMLLIGGMNGLVLASLELSGQIPAPGKPVIWEGLDGLLPAVDRAMEFGEGSLRYEFSTPLVGHYYPVRYQTRITGLDADWSRPVEFPFRETGQLYDGLNELQVRAVDPFGRTGPVATVQLEVFPPWHRTIWALLLLLGLVVLVLGLYFVVSQRRALLQRRRLEALVDERTRELQEAHEFKDIFIANLSHEIRNPLNGVIGLISRLNDDKAPPARHLEALRGAAQYLQDTVEEVLDFSKLQSGVIELEETAFDVYQMIRGVMGIYKQKAEQKHLTLSTRIDFPSGTIIRTDEGKLKQILGNLVSNAVKFTDEGSIEVHAKLITGDEACDVLTLLVRDSGVGISGENQEQVFEKFYQVQTGGLKTVGTGLGLSLIKGYLDCMKGSISLESQPGTGSTFTATIPVARGPSGGEAVDASSAPARGLNLPVLVVEDMEYNRLFMEDLLTGYGCRVDSAEDGITGLEMALSGAYKVIFLDWELPGMNGLEIATALRKDAPAGDGMMIVGTTAFATMEVRNKCLEAGMDAFLTKPLKTDELQQILNGIVPDEEPVERETPPGPPDKLISGKGLLAEMPDSDDWSALKERWLGMFKEHAQALEASSAGKDTEVSRKIAHKLVGHLRLIKADPVADILIDLMTAAHAGDWKGVAKEIDAFSSCLPRFYDEFNDL